MLKQYQDLFRLRRLSGAWERLVVFDPGFARLQMATSALVAVGSTIGVETLTAMILGTHALVPVMFGSMIAMMSSMALGGSDSSWEKTITASGFPVASFVGLGAGILIASHHLVSLAGFVLVMFLAVWIRQFGQRFFFYGFMAWMGYFFAILLHAQLAQLPTLAIATLVATAWVLLLKLTVLDYDPASRLTHMLHAFLLRGHMVVAANLELLRIASKNEGSLQRPDLTPGTTASPALEHTRKKIRDSIMRLTEAALLVDGQLGEMPSASSGEPRHWLRGWVVDAELAYDELARASSELSLSGDRAAIAQGIELLSALEDRSFDTVSQLLEQETSVPGLQHLMAASAELLEAFSHWSEDQPDVTSPSAAASQLVAAQPGDQQNDEFEPAVQLFAGMLPGTASTASSMVEDQQQSGWHPIRNMKLTTRQAWQVAVAGGLAMIAGDLISSRRYYWAMLAAFIAFTGTSTTAETLNKSLNRTLGTLFGLGFAIVLANLTSGHPFTSLAIILACIFCGFYLVRVSYGAMIFFITIMLGQLYSILHAFTGALMLLRLEETAVGSAIGIAISLVWLPTPTHSTTAVAYSHVLESLAELLEGAASTTASNRQELLGASREVDAALHQLVQLTRPLASTLFFGANNALVRHRVSLLTALSVHARMLARELVDHPGQEQPDGAASHLAEACKRLAGQSSLVHSRVTQDGQLEPVHAELRAAARALETASRPGDPVVLQFSRLVETLEALAA